MSKPQLWEDQRWDLAKALTEARSSGRFYVADMPLTTLPLELWRLPGLRAIVAPRCELGALPEWIGDLSQLESVDFSGNPITRLPSSFGQLSKLREVSLSQTQLTELDESLANLDRLKSLTLSGSRIDHLPHWIGQLRRLTELDLGNTGIASLPASFSELTKLRYLFLWGHSLSRFPDELRPLSRLEVLDLSSNGSNALKNKSDIERQIYASEYHGSRLIGSSRGPDGQITRIPSWFEAAFPNLRCLQLSGQTLESFPADLPRGLEVICLSRSEIACIPPALMGLVALTHLDLSHNRLEGIPRELSTLTTLTYLDLGDNPLEIPPEVLADPHRPEVILEYVKRVQGLTRPLNQAKLLVVGEGSVGKTSLIKRLIDDEYEMGQSKTEGIDINRWEIDGDSVSIALNIWDFGGQEIMHATHQFFLTKRSLYILVVDARQGDEQNRVEYWLKLIQSFAGLSPIVIVANKTDEAPMDLDVRGLEGKYQNIVAVLPVSCKTGSGLADVTRTLTSSLDQMAHVRDLLPLEFFLVMEELEESDKDYLTFGDYQDICERHGVIGQQAQEQLVAFLHDLGTVLCFRDDPRLADTNILNPEWVTGGVYRLLNSNRAAQRKGLLAWSDVDVILNSPDYPSERRSFIVDVMERFELCYESEGTFLVPDLLTKEEPDTGRWDDALRFEVKYDVLPSSVISRLIVRMRGWISKETLWRTGLVVAMDENRALVRGDREDAIIRVSVSGPSGGRRGVLTAIRQELRAITDTIPGLASEERVPVPERLGFWVPYQHLLALEAAGHSSVVPEGLTEECRIPDLLDGVEERGHRLAGGVMRSDVSASHTAAETTGMMSAQPWSYAESIQFGLALLASFLVIAMVFGALDVVVGVGVAAGVTTGATGGLVIIGIFVLRSSGRLSEAGMLAALKEIFRRE